MKTQGRFLLFLTLCFGQVQAQSDGMISRLPPCPGLFKIIELPDESGLIRISSSFDGRYVALDRVRDGLVLDTRTNQIVRRFGDTGGIREIRFSPRGSYLLIRSSRGVEIFDGTDVRKQDPVATIPPPEPDGEWIDLAISGNDGRISLVAKTDFSPHHELLWVSVFDLPTAVETLRLAPAIYGPSDLTLSFDGRLLALRPSAPGKIVQVWDVESGERIQRFETGAQNLTFLPDGKTLMAHGDLRTEFWDGRQGRIEAITGDLLFSATPSFSESHQLMASRVTTPGEEKAAISLWNYSTQSLECKTVEGRFRGRAAFSGDGQTLAMVSDRSPPVSADRDHSRGLELRFYTIKQDRGERSELGRTSILLPPTTKPRSPSDQRKAGSPARRPTEGDRCRVLVFNRRPDPDKLDRIDPIDWSLPEEEMNRQMLDAGLGGEIGRFWTTVEEEALTKRTFRVPGSDVILTVAVFYNDEWIPSADGGESMYLALAASSEGAVEDPFKSPDGVWSEFTYGPYSGRARLVKYLDETWLAMLDCDTTLKKF